MNISAVNEQSQRQNSGKEDEERAAAPETAESEAPKVWSLTSVID